MFKVAGLYAKYVGMALQAGGADSTGRPNDAGDYGPFLEKLNFKVPDLSPFEPYIPAKGDIAVFGIHTHGHVTAFDGSKWVSDFVQRYINPYVSPGTAGALQIYTSGNPCYPANLFDWFTPRNF